MEHRNTSHRFVKVQLKKRKGRKQALKLAKKLRLFRIPFHDEFEIEMNEPRRIANTFEFFRAMDMSEKMIRWLRIRIMDFLHSPPTFYSLTQGDQSTLSLANKCPHMSRHRTISHASPDDESGPVIIANSYIHD
eukprot:3713976-Pleurochrysis_carterae.AAC.1